MHAFALSIVAVICLAAGHSGPSHHFGTDRKPTMVEAPDSDDISIAVARPAFASRSCA